MAINIDHRSDKFTPSSETIRVSGNGAFKLPSGTTSARPVSAEPGFLRWNTDNDSLESYNGTNWESVGNVNSITLSGDSNFIITNPTVTSAGTISISLASAINIETLEISSTAKFQYVEINAGGETYFLPISAGNPGQVLTTGGDGSTLYWADVSASSSGSVLAGDGIIVSATNTVSVDETVVRTSGDQIINGFKSFEEQVVISNTSGPLIIGHGGDNAFIANNGAGVIAIRYSGINAAIIEESGTTYTFATTVVTRERGDARYAQLSAFNNFTGNMDIDGQLGIGTTTTSAKLHVVGNTIFDDGQIDIRSSQPILRFTETDSAFTDSSYYITQSNDTYNEFFNNGSTALRTRQIDLSAIGATQHNYYTGSSNLALRINQAGTNVPSPQTAITREKGDARYAQLSANNTFTEDVIVQGKLGVGVANPSREIDILGTGQISSSFYSGGFFRSTLNSSATTPSFQPGNDADTGMFLAGTNKIGFSTGGTERLIIDDSGHVGIGTSNPSEKLHVVGNTLHEGNITFDNTNERGIGFFGATGNYRIVFRENFDNISQPTVSSPQSIGISIESDSFIGLVESDASAMRGFFDLNSNAFVWGGTISIGDDTASQKLRVFEDGNSNTVFFGNTNGSFSNNLQTSRVTRTASNVFNFANYQSNDGGDNEFVFRGDGNAFADGSWGSPAADYAEMFEWEDGNPNEEDRVGHTVSFSTSAPGFIKIAQPGDSILGVVTGAPSVVGNSPVNWPEKYLKDDYGREIVDVSGNPTLNPEYDPEQHYVPRLDRPEWAPIGIIGRLRVRDGQPIGAGWIKIQQVTSAISEWLIGSGSNTNARTIVSINSDYTTLQSDENILVDTTQNPVSITLSTLTGGNGKTLIIKDKNNASSNNITITPEAGVIDGNANLVISHDKESVTLLHDGQDWWVY